MFEPEQKDLDDLRLGLEQFEFRLRRKVRMLNGAPVPQERVVDVERRLAQVKTLMNDIRTALTDMEEDVRNEQPDRNQRADRWTTRRS